MIISSLSPTLKAVSRLTRYAVTVRERRLLPLTALRFLSSSPPSGDSQVAESPSPSSGDGHDATSSTDGTMPSTTMLFPWRHESSPASRLIPGTQEYQKKGLLLTSKSQKVYGNSSVNAVVTAYMFLNVPWYELFWISHFQDELASNMSWCFTQGVASLLSKLPTSSGGDHIPIDRIISDRDDETTKIDFHETIEISKSGENGAYRIKVEDDGDGSSEKIGSSDNSNDNEIPLRRIFEEKAIELYQSSIKEVAKSWSNDSSGDQEETKRFEIRLKMTPFDSEFVTLYAIPYLSRRNSKGNPNLLDFYEKMLNEKSTGRAPYLSQLRQEHLEEKGYMESTIIAQCLVWCDELFYIKDLSTDQIVQGKNQEDDSSTTTPQTQKTPHLVRMERTVITKRNLTTGAFENEEEDWIITDIDDLLGGNLLI